MRYSSLSNLKKTLWTKFHKVVIEIGRLIDPEGGGGGGVL